MMSIGIGSILGSMTMLVLQVRDNLLGYFVGAVGLGLSMALMAATPWALLAMVPNAMFGFFLAVMIVNGQTVIQTEVPANFLGRVTSVWTIAGGIGLASSLPIGYPRRRVRAALRARRLRLRAGPGRDRERHPARLDATAPGGLSGRSLMKALGHPPRC